MASEEQTEELEVLQSIYPDELQILTPTSFRIKLALDPPPLPGASSTDDEHPTLLLHVSYPDAYPAVAPHLEITLAEDSTTSAWLSFPVDRAALLSALDDTIEENLGMAMVFTLASTLKDAAETLMFERAQAKDREHEERLQEEEEKEMAKFRGDLVTKERFVAWRERFMAEMEAAKKKVIDDEEEARRKGKAGKVEERKMTGRELWEKGLAGNVDEEEEDGETVDIAKLKLGN